MHQSRVGGRTVLTAALATALGLVGCGGGHGGSAPPPPATLQSIAVSPSTATVTAGDTSQLKATGTYSDGHTADLTGSTAWTVDQATCATAGANTGLVNAVQGIGTCTANVTATYSGMTSEAVITVNGLYATQAPLNFLSYYPVRAVSGDFNGDGMADLFGTDLLGDTVAALGTGNGDFATITPVLLPGGNTVPGSGGFLVVGDFNRDGKDDVVVSIAQGLVYLPGASPGPFGTGSIFANLATEPTSLAVGDIDGDGKLDLAVVSSYGKTLSIILGDGAGGFSSPTTIALNIHPDFVAIADINGDGNADVLVADYTVGEILVFPGNGTGGFGMPAATTTGAAETGGLPHAAGAVVADFNGDGKPDIAINNGGTGVEILLGDGSGSFQSGGDLEVGTTVETVAVLDANGDGKLDIVALGADLLPSSSQAANVRIFLGTGTGSFGTPIQVSWGAGGGGGYTKLLVADLNGDGKPDLLVTQELAPGGFWKLLHQ